MLCANLAVAIAKIALGYYSGTVSIISDGFHSLTDSASNVVGLVGVSVASRPPDANHPYGHRKYETMASVGILVFLSLVLVEVLRAAASRLLHGGTPRVFPEGYYFVMGDHRNNSSDSRHWGFVPKRYIIGKVQVRWWPIPTARVF